MLPDKKEPSWKRFLKMRNLRAREASLMIEPRQLDGTFRCRECGCEISRRRSTKEFCEIDCRRSFNNRKAARGAQLYDLVMALRLDRGAAAEHGIFSLICRMVRQFANEDAKADRQTWNISSAARARHIHLIATVIGHNMAGNPRRRSA